MIENVKMSRSETFKRNVEQAIKKAGNSPEVLAGVIGTKPQTVREWRWQGREKGFGPAITAMKKLAEYLGYKNMEGLFLLEPDGFAREEAVPEPVNRIPNLREVVPVREVSPVKVEKDSPYKNLLYVRQRMQEFDDGPDDASYVDSFMEFNNFRKLADELGGWDELVKIVDVLKQLTHSRNGQA